jgi:hypothetical protein
MINLSCSAAALATSAVVRAAQLLLSDLEHGRRIDAAGTLRVAMQTALSASDASCAWHWKAAYDACEAATVLFLRKYASSMRAKAGSPALMLSMLAKVAGLLPTQSRRSEESKALEQFSTPVAVGFVACRAVGITKKDLVLKPSMRDRLRAYGLFSEIISWKLRMFVPTDERGGGALAQMFERHPVERIGEREAA